MSELSETIEKLNKRMQNNIESNTELNKEITESETSKSFQCCGGTNRPENKRKYLPTLGNLCDRLSINSLKEVFLKDYKEQYAQEIVDIKHDIDLILKENNINVDSDFIYALVIMAQYNLHIWMNESNYRKNGDKAGTDLALTHGLNSLRNYASNKVEELVRGRKDYKLDNVKAFPEWVPSLYKKDYENK